MHYNISRDTLKTLVNQNLDDIEKEWLIPKIEKVVSEISARNFFLVFSLSGSKIENRPLRFNNTSDSVFQKYLESKKATVVEMARLYLLFEVLTADVDFFGDQLKKLMQLADITELETILKYLVWLPHAENFKIAAVDHLRTNVATVFDAISMENPYPALYFNDQQWNQMFLKAAFMGRDLSKISAIDERANKDLARIISDYAHERWAASRHVDTDFWRPVSPFLEAFLLEDMQRLFQSENPLEQKVASLCCYASENPEAQKLLDSHPDLKNKIIDKSLTWENYKN